MKKTMKGVISVFIITLFCQCKVKSHGGQQADKVKADWVWLFDGKSTDAWEEAGKETFPATGWIVKNNELIVLGKGEKQKAGRDIITKKEYSNFDLQLECKLMEGGNSGIKYFVKDDFPGHEGEYLGLEYQLIDDDRHPDAKMGRNGDRTMGSLYDLIPAPADKKLFPPDEWNKVRIVVDSSHVEHWLNDKKLFEYNRQSDTFKQLVHLSKYKNLVNFGQASKGHILLQGHGDTVAFRKIKIRYW